MRQYALALPLACSLVFSSGCATIIKGRYQDLTINSNPPGANFEVDGIQGVTPATVPVQRKLRSHTVVISKPGYETAQIRVGRELNLWTLGNVVWGLFGLPVGVGCDLISGSAYKLASGEVRAELHPQHPVANATHGGPIIEAQHVQPPFVVPPPKPNEQPHP